MLDSGQAHAAASVERGTPLDSDPFVAGWPFILGQMLKLITARTPDDEAIVTRAQRTTYNGLFDRSVAITRGLVAIGVRKGTRIGILLPASRDRVASLFGFTVIRAVAVALNTFARKDHLEHMLRRRDSQFLISSGPMANRPAESDPVKRHPWLVPARGADRDLTLPALRRTFHLDADELTTDGEGVSHDLVETVSVEVSSEDETLVTFTSGSTGRPKVLRHMHRAMCIPSWCSVHLKGRSAEDRIFSTSPFFWSSGLTRILGNALAAEATLVLQEHFEPAEALELLERERITSILCRPHLDHRLLQDPDFATLDLLAIRWAYEENFLGQRPGILHPPRPGYGMTETMTLVSQTPSKADPNEPGFTPVLPGMSVRTVDPDSGRILPRNTLSRICVRGATLMLGYCKRPRADIFDEDTYFLTSDAGLIDDEGRFHWTGRFDNMAKVAAANVYLIGLERRLASLGGCLRSTSSHCHTRYSVPLSCCGRRPQPSMPMRSPSRRRRNPSASEVASRQLSDFARDPFDR